MSERIKQNKFWLILATAVIGLSVFFLVLVDNYLDGDGLTRWDTVIYQWVETIRTPLLTKLMLFITLMANYQIITGALILGIILLGLAKKWRYAWALITSVMVGILFTELTKILFARPRPPLQNALIPTDGFSFPSGHSYFAIVFYGLITYFWVKHFNNKVVKIVIGILGIGLGLMIGFSRIYLGVHWTTDVLAGLASSGIWWLLIVGYIEYQNKYFATEYKRFNHKLVWRGFWLFTLVWLGGIIILFLGNN